MARLPRAGTLRITTPRPPIRLAEPGRICSVVMPPAMARWKPGSWGHTLCSAHTPGVVGAVASLPSPCARAPGDGYTPRWECVSIRPGVTCLPATSSTVAPATLGGAPSPTARMRPSSSTTKPFSIGGPAAVHTVAPTSTTAGAAGASTVSTAARPRASRSASVRASSGDDATASAVTRQYESMRVSCEGGAA